MKIIANFKIERNTSEEKPNEDFVICDIENNIYILLDGVTRDRVKGVYPNPSPSAQVAQIFANFVHSTIVKKINVLDSILLNQIVIEGNKMVAEFNSRKEWDFLPGAVGIISVIINGLFIYSYIGDCTGVLIRNNEERIFTISQTELIKKNKKNYAPKYIRNEICNNPFSEFGYGVITGQEKAKHFIVTSNLIVQEGDVIILHSDGLDELFKKEGYKKYALNNLSNIMIDAKKIEDEELPKKSDDKSIIYLKYQ